MTHVATILLLLPHNTLYYTNIYCKCTLVTRIDLDNDYYNPFECFSPCLFNNNNIIIIYILLLLLLQLVSLSFPNKIIRWLDAGKHNINFISVRIQYYIETVNLHRCIYAYYEYRVDIATDRVLVLNFDSEFYK